MCIIVNPNIQITYKPEESHVLLAAYYLWLKANQPVSNGAEFYYQAEKECNYAICYKVLTFFQRRLISPLKYYEWQLGWNYAKSHDDYSASNVSTQGFHMFINYQDADYAAQQVQGRVVPVHCYKEDFIAAGFMKFTSWTPITFHSLNKRGKNPNVAINIAPEYINPPAIAHLSLPPESLAPLAIAFSKVYVPKLPKFNPSLDKDYFQEV